MKRHAKWAAGAGLAAIIAAGFAPMSFWSKPLRDELREQLTRTTALDADAHGRVQIAALPYPRVTYEDVRIGHPDGTVSIIAPKITAGISVSRLIAGRIEFTGLRLLNPRIVVDGAGALPENTPAIRRAIDAPPASAEARRADRARVGAVRIVGGSMQVHAYKGLAVTVDSLNATVDWPSLGAPAIVSGEGKWRGEAFTVEALLGKPAEVLRGEKSPLTLKLSSRALDLSVDGSFAGGSRWLLDARVASSSERFGHFLHLLDAQPAIPGRLSRFALSGQVRALPQTATLSDLKLAIDSNTFDGSLTLLYGEKRPKVSGTLATRTYDLRPREAGLPVLRRHRQWSREAIHVGRLDMFDADLRLSAARVELGNLALTEAGFVISLDNGRLEITTAEATAYGGSLRGRWSFDSRTAIPQFQAAGSFKNIDLGPFLRSIGHPNVASGAASGEFQLQTNGTSVHAMMQNASGAGRAAVRAPEIIGVDLERALRRSERRPLSIPSEVRSGQTSFLTADVEAVLDGGVLAIERAHATGHGVEVAARGKISLPDRTMRLEIGAKQPRPPKAPADGKEPAALVLDLEGPWEDPALSIDPESLISRSEAAAPLLRRRKQEEPVPAVPAVAAPADR